MERLLVKNNFCVSLNVLIRILCILGIVFIISGIILVAFSFKNEVLDDKYIVKTAAGYISDDVKLSEGELSVTKNTEYVGNGIYKVVYTNHARAVGKKSLIETGSSFFITDMLGKGYELITEKIKINDTECKLNNDKFDKKKIGISYDNNIINIEIPDKLILNKNKIEVYIKLVSREVNKKYPTSQETYFSFKPSSENDFYNKKAVQSYMVEGYGYIELDER